MKKEDKSYGKAYAFFDCNASKKAIEAELPKARHYAEVPSDLELNLIEGTENLSRDAEAMKALEAAKKYSLSRLPKSQREGNSVTYQYALQAKLPNAANLSTANKMNRIMSLLYGHELYPKQEEFFGEIVYKRGKQ